jgi:hypothetical protein
MDWFKLVDSLKVELNGYLNDWLNKNSDSEIYIGCVSRFVNKGTELTKAY